MALQVRVLISEGKAAEAADLCSEVTETLLDEVLAGGDAYAAYVAGWELQRKYAVSEAALDLGVAAPAKKVRAATELVNELH
jgi:hypothetical protein